MFRKLFSRRKLINQSTIRVANQAMMNSVNPTATLTPSTITVPTVAAGSTYTINTTMGSSILSGGVGNYNAGQGVYSNITIGNIPTPTFTIGSSGSSTVISFHNQTKEIVRLNKDGSVTWHDEINIDDAAEAFAKSFTIGAEMLAGITQGTKTRMRDSVFNDIIAIAREKGSLTADDLTYMLEASKIVEKLKGGNE